MSVVVMTSIPVFTTHLLIFFLKQLFLLSLHAYCSYDIYSYIYIFFFISFPSSRFYYIVLFAV